MQRTDTRILYKQGDLPEIAGKVLPIPRNFTARGGRLRGWYPTPDQVTGTWRKPGPVPVEQPE